MNYKCTVSPSSERDDKRRHKDEAGRITLIYMHMKLFGKGTFKVGLHVCRQKMTLNCNQVYGEPEHRGNE